MVSIQGTTFEFHSSLGRINMKSHPVIDGTGAAAAASVTVMQVALLEMDGV
jgi:hypothetical protein